MTRTSTPACAVLHAASEYTGKQAINYLSGISAESTGARGICMHLLTIPPGGHAKAHLHEHHETAIYILQGEAHMWCGEKLAQDMVARAGDFVYIPAGMPHLPYNASATETCIAVIARTDPNEQESVILLPELDALHQ